MSLLIGTASGAFALDSSLTPMIEGPHIQHIARHGDRWWALDDGGQVWREGEVVATAPPGVKFNCVRPTDETVWLGASAARLFRLDDGALSEDAAFADAPGRRSWHTPWGGPPDVRSMAVDTAGTLFVNVHVGGILRYEEDGPLPTLEIDADVHEVAAHPDQAGVVLAACARGLAETANGHDFSFRTEGLSSHYCRAVLVDDDSVFISASRGPGGGQARLFRGAVDGGELEQCRQGLPESFERNLNTHCLAAADQRVVAGNGRSVWSSDDHGETWRTVASDLPQVTCLA